MPVKFESGMTVSPQRPRPVPPSPASVFQLTQPVYSLKDMVLRDEQAQAIEEVLALAKYESLIFHTWGLERVIKRGRGLKVNFFGAPGTGKSMAAHAVAKELGKPLLEVSYADVESKYVGETPKNIVALFHAAEEKQAVLFFDEADALLSKRVTEMHSSSDVSVNQTRSVLLKLLDEYSGVCLFTTNFIRNYDPAFMRRITRHICFQLPDEAQREKLWRHYLVVTLPNEANVSELAKKYPDVSGSDIANAVLNAAIHGAFCHTERIPHDFFERAINDILLAKRENTVAEVLSTREVSREYVQNALREGKME